MSRMRIALVAHGIHFRGGMERAFAELARALCWEHDVHLVTAEVCDVPIDQVTIHPISVRQKPLLVKFFQFYAKSSRLLQKEDFDIVHTIGGITARQNVVTAQYCQSAWGQVIAEEPGAAEGISAYHRFMWRLTGYFEKQAVNSAYTKIICANSERTKVDLQRFYGTDLGKIHVVYNGVDPARFSPENARYRADIRRRYQIAATDFVILFVGEYRRKGLANVIRALGQLNVPDVHLLAIGSGDQTYYTALAAQSGVSTQITLAGPASDIERIFGAVDAFVFPTFYEPFGMVITEAMASGLPVVTSRSAGAAEFIEDGATGFLLDNPGNVEELTGKLKTMLSLGSLRDGIGSKARQSVSHYDWQKVAEETLNLYQQIKTDKRTA